MNEASTHLTPFRYGWNLALLFLAAAALLFFFLGEEPLAGVEGINAEGARLLLLEETPKTAGPRFLCNALLLRESIRCFGLSEIAVRLPSVAAALLLLAGSVILAARYCGKKGAIVTGWMLLSSYGFLYWGRSAAGAIFPATWVVWACVLCVRGQKFSFLQGFTAGLFLFFSLIFLNNLIFLYLFLLWLPACCSRAFWKREGKKFACLGMLTALLLTAAAGMFQMHQLTGESGQFFSMLIREGEQPLLKWLRARDGFSFSSLLHLPRLLLPWPLFTAAALVEIIRQRKRIAPQILRMGISLLLMFLLSVLWSSWRWGVLLPLLPFFLILTEAGTDRALGFRLGPFLIDKTMRALLMAAGSLLTVFPVSWPLWKIMLRQKPPLCIMFLLPLLGLLALAVLNAQYLPDLRELPRKLIPSPYAGTLLAGTVVAGALLCVLQPGMSSFRAGKRFWDSVCTVMAQKEVPEILFFRSAPQASAAFYLRRPHDIPQAGNAAQLEAFLRQYPDDSLLLIAKQNDENLELLKKVAANAGWTIPSRCDISENPPLQLARQEEPDDRDPSELFGAWILQKK